MSSCFRIPDWVVTIGIGKVYGIPIAAAIWIILAIVMHLVLKRTTFGQYVYALAVMKGYMACRYQHE
jgi:ribose/xylose/arabinose/galactoside ABC-type transport system permease subunit